MTASHASEAASPSTPLSVTLGELVEALRAEFQSEQPIELRGNPATVIHRIGPLDTEQPGTLSFLSNPRYRSQLATTRASCVIVGPAAETETEIAIVEGPKAGEVLVETFRRGARTYLVVYPFEGRLAHQTLGMLLTRRLERAGDAVHERDGEQRPHRPAVAEGVRVVRGPAVAVVERAARIGAVGQGGGPDEVVGDQVAVDVGTRNRVGAGAVSESQPGSCCTSPTVVWPASTTRALPSNG